MSHIQVLCWLLDVEPLWAMPFEGAEPFKSTERWALGQESRDALNLLSADEKAKVLKFYRHTDAKLCLGSCLLKRRAISKFCDIAWDDVILSEDENRKPCYQPKDPAGRNLQFNVSHHGTLVALIGCSDQRIQLGVDIVRMNWEKDYSSVMKDGFEKWTGVYGTVFSDREIRDIAHYVPPEQVRGDEEIRAKLRHFYTHWCLKEAYVKMTGEALVAKWLRELEFRNVRVPLAAEGCDGDEWGQTCSDIETWFKGTRVEDVKLEIRAFRGDYMIATAVSDINTTLGAFRVLRVEQDVYPMQDGICTRA
ncbi:MAG: hypothetical protein Q9163_001118 [Psora crenata]